ncbi:MFS transporter [Nonomuraea sp. NPDC048916]|uniref:MFS transporter n=1 Tax=Nonomuraea sp. NPDC048916 TaxID=3154232 RepID=UPI0033D2FAA7
MITSYRQLLAHPGALRLVVISLLAKLGTPALSLALLLAAVDRLGSYGAAGLVLTGHALALAVCAPLGGRLADRLGARRVLVGYLLAHTAAFSLILLALATQLSSPVLVAAAALLGATNPPVTAVIRSAWPRLVPAESLPAAYAVDSAINELMFILGPVLVSVLLLVMSAQTVVVVTGATILLSVATLTASEVVRQAPAEPPTPRGGARLARLVGPLSHRPTFVLLVIAMFGTFSFGCLRIATVAAATTFGSTASAGVLMGLLSAGALVGGLVFGARSWPVSGRTLLILMFVADAASLLAAGFAPGLLTLGLVITVTGLLTGPRDTLQPALLAEQTPALYRTEVFAWLNTFMWSGYGLGTAVAGHLTGPTDTGMAAFTAAAAVALLAAILVAVFYRPSLGTQSITHPGSRDQRPARPER